MKSDPSISDNDEGLDGVDRNLPKAIASGELRLAPGLTVQVHVLDNGQRVIDEEDWRRIVRWLDGTQ